MAKAGLLFVGTDDGLVLYSNPNEIGRWLKIGQPLRGQVVRAVWALPDAPQTVIVAVDGLGLQRSEDGGQSWQTLLSGTFTALLGQRAGRALVYALGAAGPLVSADGGASWASIAHPGEAPGAMALAAASQLYLGAGDRVLASADGGASWAAYGVALPGPVAALAALPQQPGTLFAVAGERLYTCTGSDAPWVAGAEAPATRGPLVALAGATGALLAPSLAGGIARRADGAAWAPSDAVGDVTALAAASYHVDVAVAGTADGQVLLSADRGRSWQVLKQGLAPVRSVAAARLV